MAVDVNNWYQGVLGRDADAAGLAAWNTALTTGGMSEADAFNWFKDSAVANGETVNGSFGMGSTYVAPKGVTNGGDSSTLTDEWAFNNGVTLSAAQAAQLKSDYATASGQGVTASTDLYSKFLADNGISNGLDYGTASRFGTAAPAPAPAPAPYYAPAPSPAPSLGYNLSDVQAATPTFVSPATQTVAGQLQSILNADNPLMQQARSRAQQTANASGMLNSSMAQTAGDASMFAAAMPIASADASTNYDANKTSTAAENTFNTASNLFTTQGIMADFNVTANDWAAAQKAERDRVQAEINQTYNLANIAAGNANTVTNATNAANVAAAAAAQLNTNNVTNAATAAANTATVAATARLYGARADYATSVNAINSNTSMGAEARNDATAALQTNYNTIITQAAVELGWSADSWVIKGGLTA